MKAIRTARIRAGLTQKRLAELVDRDQSEISRIEAGKTAVTVPLLLRLARALKVPPGKLLDETRDDAHGRASAAEGRTPRAAKAA
jgi:transcriptional regulator with XRE-family HTH domain